MNNIESVIVILLIFLLGIAVSEYGLVKLPSKLILSEAYGYDQNKLYFKADYKGTVKGTGSMLPCIDEYDTLYYREVGEDEILWEGEVYVYQKNESTTVLHRLVGVVDDNQEKLIFKGDHGLAVDDVVNRSQILYELIGVCYESGFCP